LLLLINNLIRLKSKRQKLKNWKKNEQKKKLLGAKKKA